jgi:molybdenum cofactor cytidylyltransferase
MAAHSDIPIIILAAGQSRRMRGRDKLLEQVQEQPLLRRQAELALGVTTGEVIVALPPAPHPRYDALSGLPVTRLPVAQAAEGMNASLRTAFGALPKNAKAAMIVLADLPELTTSDLKTIVFTAALFPAFATLTGDTGGREVIRAAGDRVQLVPLPGDRARCDLDTPEQWDAWRKAHPSK